ncbi:DNA polymerase III subunit gamma/tau [Microbacterium oleivorans]|uniref:DNA polymerase III subunit gamma/tau n=1 Tax=Microbacterium oleivorans TaxID=273677 RepID=A0A7D5IS43_9MICO|nr:DNA polymerase III subunit gamma/tau [Microbacterium oleivorans]QLD13121.1 DNA polymerase III subunit gamma/tau [Microbacterium oleivorans]
MTQRDDDALSWAGDDDPTLVAVPGPERDTSRPTPSEPPVAHGRRVSDDLASSSGAESAALLGAENAASADEAGAVDGPRAMSSAALVSLGVLGGVYLLYTIGWIVGGLRLNEISGFIVAPSASVPAVVVAILAPAIWFVVVLTLTRARPAWQRFAWLVAGAVLLVPWPFAMLGTGL